jgi:hypothetical protein
MFLVTVTKVQGMNTTAKKGEFGEEKPEKTGFKFRCGLLDF